MKDMKGLKVKKMELFCLSKSVPANQDGKGPHKFLGVKMSAKAHA